MASKRVEGGEEGLPPGLGALRACSSLLASLSMLEEGEEKDAEGSHPFQSAMLADSGRGLSLLVRLLDVAKVG